MGKSLSAFFNTRLNTSAEVMSVIGLVELYGIFFALSVERSSM